jgi:hypothetical protein
MYPKASLGTNGAAATVELGQPSATAFTSNTPNNGGVSASSLSVPTVLAFDSSGNLWVADFSNSRVLKFANTALSTGQVTILIATCGVNTVSGSTINYGSLLPGATSTEQTVVLQNSGNIAGTLLVQGTGWVDSTGTSQMLVGNTKFSTTTGIAYPSKTALATTLTTVGTLGTTSNLSTFWQLQPNLITPGFSGPLTQTVTFTTTC